MDHVVRRVEENGNARASPQNEADQTNTRSVCRDWNARDWSPEFLNTSF